MGSTKGTNALLERKGASTALIITKGFKDLLEIGDQQREHLFSLSIKKIAQFYDHVIEVEARMDSEGNELIPLTEHKQTNHSKGA